MRRIEQPSLTNKRWIEHQRSNTTHRIQKIECDGSNTKDHIRRIYEGLNARDRTQRSEYEGSSMKDRLALTFIEWNVHAESSSIGSILL